MDIGVQIRALRESKHISRESMADLLNISANTYTKIKLGDRIPNLNELQIISDRLEVDPAIFLNRQGNYVKNGDNSPGVVGYNNVVTIDKDLIKALTTTLDKLSKVMDKM